MTQPIRFALLMVAYLNVIPCFASAHATKQAPEALFNEGILLFEQKQYTTAQHYLEQYLQSRGKKYHKETAAYYRILSALENKDPYIETLVQHFAVSYPNSLQLETLRYRLAKFFFEKGWLDKSLSLYKKVNMERLAPKERDAYPYELAGIYLQLKDWSNAKENFSKIKDKSHPYYYPTQLRIAYIAFEQGNFDHALAALKEASKHKNYLPEARSLTLQVYHKMGAFEALLSYIAHCPEKTFTKQDQLLIGDAYFFLQQYKAAVTHYQAYLGNATTDRKTLAKLAYALYALEQYAQALTYFGQLSGQEDHESQVAAYYSGLIYEQEGSTQAAIDAFEKAARQKFDVVLYDLAYLKRAGIYYQQGAFEEVIQSMHSFIQESPSSEQLANAHVLLITCYYQTKAYKKAIDYITALPYKNETILQLYQKILFYQGLEAYNQGALDSALAYLKQSLHFPFNPSLVLQAQFWVAETFAGLEAYNKALKFYTQLMAQGSINTLYHEKTLYGLAYAYFNTGNYTAAISTFKQYLDITSKQPAATHYDAMLRLGDCYYVKKNYTQALQLYEQTYAYHPAHVRYQEALIYQILGDTLRSEQCLQEVLTQHAQTKYYEKACYHEACTLFNAGHYETAIQKFSYLIDKGPTSVLQPDLLMKRALAYENLQKNQEASLDYIAILDQFPTHTHAESALMALSHLFAGTPEKMDLYLQKHKRVAQAVTSDSDIHTLDAIRKLFYSQAYPKVLQQLATFYKAYPESPLLPEAYFLMAESYYRLHKTNQALSYYKKVVASKKTDLHIKAWLRMADLTYQSKQFREALGYYQKLEQMPLADKAYERTLMGIVKTSFALKQYKITIPACVKLLNNPKGPSIEMTQQAHFYLGKIAMQRAEYKSAKNHFLKASMPLHTVTAAEAQYLLAHAAFKLKAYNTSLNALFTLTEKFPHHTHYKDDAFLLMADNYMLLGNFTQAKATLDSIIKQSKNKKTIALAKEKRKKVVSKLKGV